MARQGGGAQAPPLESLLPSDWFERTQRPIFLRRWARWQLLECLRGRICQLQHGWFPYRRFRGR